MLPGQLSLLGQGVPALDRALGDRLRRRWLDATAWVDYGTGFVTGHEALMAALVESTRWQQPRREMYEKIVEVPRLVAGLPGDGPGHPLIEEMRLWLSDHY